MKEERDESRRIYVYTTPAEEQLGHIKVGDTTQDIGEEGVRQRIMQQLGTGHSSTDYTLLDWWHSPVYNDKQLHKVPMLAATRVSSNREWFETTIEVVKKAYNEMAQGIARKDNFKMRPEQQRCHDFAVSAVGSGEQDILLSAIMRFGKTFTTYQIAKTLGRDKVLILTGKPEVKSGWKDDLNNHVDFVNYKFFDIGVAKEFEEALEYEGKAVMFSSLAFLLNRKGRSELKKRVAELGIDLLVIDEEHHGSKTQKAMVILEKFKDVTKLYLSGTPYKSLESGKFLKDRNCFTWTYKYSQTVELSRRPPQMNIFSIDIPAIAIEKTNNDVMGDGGGFLMSNFFETDKSGDFVNEKAVRELVEKLFNTSNAFDDFFGDEHGVSGKFHPPTIVKNKFESSRYHKTHFKHILMRMPRNIAAARAMAEIIEEKTDYKAIIAAGSGEDTTVKIDDLKMEIKKNKKTVTISVGRFETGVTVREWGAVYRLDDGESLESYCQFNFRGSTDWENGGKEKFFIFDLAPQRAFNMHCLASHFERVSGEPMLQSVENYIKTAPIFTCKGGKFVEMNAQEIVAVWNNSKRDLSKRFASEYGITNRFDAQSIAALEGIMPSESKSLRQDFNKNKDLKKGKSHKEVAKALKGESRKSFKSAIEKLKTVLRRMPIVVTVLETYEVEALLAKKESKRDSEVFKTITGIDIHDYELFLASGLLNRDFQEDCFTSVANHVTLLNTSDEALWDSLSLYANNMEASPGTPPALVNEMLDKLPAVTWTDSSKTFVDPCFSNGAFIFCLIERLMKGLSIEIPDEQERIKHILENQVYGYEMNEVPYLFVESVLEHKYKTNLLNIRYNLCYNNILEMNWEREDMKFDVVAGNPPYSRQLWVKFLETIKEELSPRRIAIITPDKTSHPYSSGAERDRKLYSEAGLYCKVDCTDRFPVSSGKISYFICDVHNKEQYEFFPDTKDNNIMRKVTCTTKQALVLRGNTATKTKMTIPQLKSAAESNKTDTHSMPFMQGVTSKNDKPLVVSYIEPKEYRTIQEKTAKEEKGKWFCVNRFFDRNGVAAEAVITGVFVGGDVLIFKARDGELLESFIEVYYSKLYRHVMTFIRGDGFDITASILSMFVRPDLSRSWTDAQLYQHFNLTQEEINHIEESVK